MSPRGSKVMRLQTEGPNFQLKEAKPDEHMAHNPDHSAGSSGLRWGRMGIQPAGQVILAGAE
jgi:hypothetical protein